MEATSLTDAQRTSASRAAEDDAYLLMEWAQAEHAQGTLPRQRFLDAVRDWARDYQIDDPWGALADFDLDAHVPTFDDDEGGQ